MSPTTPQFQGIDFGTTNSAIALSDEAGTVSLARFPFRGEPSSVCRSVIYFDPERRGADRRPMALVGPEAIESYLEGDEGMGRLILSIKSYLGSRTFNSTNVQNRVYSIEELAAIILRGMRRQAEVTLGTLPLHAVVGRPVHFAHAEGTEDDDFAMSRLTRAFELAGYESVVFEYEPVAAAYYYESTLDHDELVLAADFGGGTSDFCLMRMGPGVRKRGRTREDVLGTDGVGLAGDALDAKIIDHVVSPRLGLGSMYRTYMEQRDQVVPNWLFTKLRRWHHLSFLKSKETMSFLERLQQESLEPRKIEALIDLIRDDLGYRLYEAVERTKVALSSSERARFTFREGAAEMDTEVSRADFEGWIGDETQAMSECVDRLLGATGVSPKDVNRVFMTGGTSFVPAIRRIFEERFGADRLGAGNELTSVAIGLALSARDRAAMSGAPSPL